MQHRHLTPLQLDAMNRCTMQSVQTNTLHGSSSGLCIIARHKGHRSWSSMSGLLELASIMSCTEKPVCIGGRALGCVTGYQVIRVIRIFAKTRDHI